MDSTTVRTAGEPFRLKVNADGVDYGVLGASAELLGVLARLGIEDADQGPLF